MSNQTQDFQVKTHPLNHITRTIAVLSGKGGVGKSMITGLLATYLQRTGQYRVGILDADVTGPSIPKLFGVEKIKPRGSEDGLFPVRTHSDIQLMSINLLLEDPGAPVVWRGPILANTVKQFWTDVIWGELDFLLIDMPPGTGDIPLTVFQSLPLDGIIIVTSPQDLVAMIVQKAIQMAKMMSIPIIGLVENMSHVVCPHCQESFSIFGNGKTEAVAREANIPYLGNLPIDPELAALCDQGNIERFHKRYLDDSLAALERMIKPGKNDDEPAINEVSQNQVPASGAVKIAIASDGTNVTEHFGHCAGFVVMTIENQTTTDRAFVENPGHKPGFLPNFLHDRGIQVIIAGGMGSGAVEIFKEKGIEVITGASGSVDTVVEQYRSGQLKSTGSVCHDHQHADSCEDHA